MDFDAFFDVAMEHLQSVTRTETIIGEPFDAGGRRFVPITEVRLGIGSGGGSGQGGGAKDATSGGTGGGGGLGGGFRVSPVAVVCMDGDTVEVMPVMKRTGTLERVLELVPDVLARVREARLSGMFGGAPPATPPVEDAEG